MPMPAHAVRDRINFNTSIAPLKTPAFALIDTLQNHTADVQLQALALTLATMCRPLGVDPHELVTRANRQLLDADAFRNPHLEAIAAYAAGELN